MLHKEFAKIYPQLREFTDKIHKENFTSDDILADLYVYLDKNYNKIEEGKLKPFCDRWIWNTISYNNKDFRKKYNKYNNKKFVSFDDSILTDVLVEENSLDDEDKILYDKLMLVTETLELKLKEYFTLYYINKYTIQEISELKMVSVGLVHYYIKKILKHINKKI